MERQINTIEQRAGDAVHVFLAAAWRAAAFTSAAAEIAAATGVHCGHQLEPCRVGDACVGPRHGGAAALRRTTQGLECLRGKFRQLVEEQYASMCQAYLARACALASARQRSL